MVKPEDITAIILCGGLGTRLHSVTNDKIPKPMVEVVGRPFLEYLLDYLVEQGVTKAILAVSYNKKLIIKHFGEQYRNLKITYSIEEEPLGTGGAIKYAIQHYVDPCSKFILVLNGDTFVEYNLKDMVNKAEDTGTRLVMAVKTLKNTDRYGRVTVDENSHIKAFEEKKSGDTGQISTGVYLLSASLANNFPSLAKFSFETDFLENKVNTNELSASLVNGYFIDIGIPKDYLKAQIDFEKKLALNHEE